MAGSELSAGRPPLPLPSLYPPPPLPAPPQGPRTGPPALQPCSEGTREGSGLDFHGWHHRCGTSSTPVEFGGCRACKESCSHAAAWPLRAEVNGRRPGKPPGEEPPAGMWEHRGVPGSEG